MSVVSAMLVRLSTNRTLVVPVGRFAVSVPLGENPVCSPQKTGFPKNALLALKQFMFICHCSPVTVAWRLGATVSATEVDPVGIVTCGSVGAAQLFGGVQWNVPFTTWHGCPVGYVGANAGSFTTGKSAGADGGVYGVGTVPSSHLQRVSQR
jgi:hypothetical protein